LFFAKKKNITYVTYVLTKKISRSLSFPTKIRPVQQPSTEIVAHPAFSWTLHHEVPGSCQLFQPHQAPYAVLPEIAVGFLARWFKNMALDLKMLRKLEDPQTSQTPVAENI